MPNASFHLLHADVDFICVNAGSYIFNRANSRFTIRCRITQDNLVEVEENFYLTISTSTRFNVTLDPDSTQVVIANDYSELSLVILSSL